MNPTRFSNQFFKLLLTRKWVPRKWDGPLQYEAVVVGEKLMMLETDLALIKDPEFRVWAEKYAADQKLFFEHFAAAFAKLLELGVDRDGSGVAPLVKGGCPYHAGRAAVNRMGAGEAPAKL